MNDTLAVIAHAVSHGQYRYTVHGAQQRIARGIKRHELEEAIAQGEIIEDYPTHHYGPACLLLGRTATGRPLHILVGLRPVLAIVTLYDPSPDEWEQDLKTRKEKQT